MQGVRFGQMLTVKETPALKKDRRIDHTENVGPSKAEVRQATSRQVDHFLFADHTDQSASKHPAVRDDLIGGSPVKLPIARDSSGTAPGATSCTNRFDDIASLQGGTTRSS